MLCLYVPVHVSLTAPITYVLTNYYMYVYIYLSIYLCILIYKAESVYVFSLCTATIPNR